MLNYGIGYGVIKGCAMSLGCQYIEVSPKTWQAQMYKGTDARIKSKEKAYQAAKMIWPNIDQYAIIGKSKKPHDGVVDASLIAEYGRLKYV